MRASLLALLFATVGAASPLPIVQRAYAQTNTLVRYSEVGRSLLFAPTYIAAANGYFRDEGLNVEVSTANGSDKATAALLTEGADIALVGPETAVFIHNGQSPTKIKIFCGLTATGGDFLVSREAVPNFKWSSLKGKTILSWREGSAPDLLLQSVLRQNGLDPVKDVTLIRNVGIPARLGAFLSGTGDFGVFYEPDPSRMTLEGRGHVLASIGAAAGPIEYTVFAATDKFLQEHPHVAQGWTNAIYKAEKWLAIADAEQTAKLLMPYFPGLSIELIVSAIKRQRDNNIWKPAPTVERDGMNKVQSLLIEGGLLKESERVDYDAIVSAAFARKAIETVH